jgi:hypothetical protein
MPLVRFDLIEGRDERTLEALLDATHEVLVSVFGIPVRDRYQVVQEHRPGRLIVQDSGLDIPRTDKIVMLSIASRPRSDESKVVFYAELCRALKERCAIEPTDVMVSITSNTNADWSFGYGRAQFLTREL